MRFIKSIFSRKVSSRPEDYQPLFVKWDHSGKEYGPKSFADLILQNWSGPPLIGRFENESKWRDYSYFLEILDKLLVSREQMAFLVNEGVVVDADTLTFKEAQTLIGECQEKLHEKRAAERKEKEKLPATKHIRKKMDSLGIDYHEDITRAEAKRIIAEHEYEQDLQRLIMVFKKRGIVLPVSLISEHESEQTESEESLVDYLEHLNDLLTQLEKLCIEYSFPSDINIKMLSTECSSIESAIFEAEEVVDQIKDRDVSTDEEEYRLVGQFSKKQVDAAKKEVTEKTLLGTWDSERDLVRCIKTHFPKVRLKVVEY